MASVSFEMPMVVISEVRICNGNEVGQKIHAGVLMGDAGLADAGWTWQLQRTRQCESRIDMTATAAMDKAMAMEVQTAKSCSLSI